MVVPLLFGVGCLVVLALACLTRQEYGRNDAVLAALGLFASYAITKVAGYGVSWSQAHRLYPALDLAMVAVIMQLWWAKPEMWKLAIGFALLTKLIIHVCYWSWGAQAAGNGGSYVLLLNILFGFELLFAAWAGGRIVGNHLVRLLSDHRRAGHGYDPEGARPAHKVGRK